MAEIVFEGAGVTAGERTILAPTDLVLREQRIAVIGGNGSGKSTLARLINGLIEPTVGRVLVDSHDTVGHGAHVRRQVGFCFTDPSAQLVMPTCVEDVELSLRKRLPRAERRPAALATLARFGLEDRADVSVHALSGGQRQLLALAGVLAVEPDVLVADEPTTLLDLANTRLIGDLLLSLPQQLVLVTHDLALAARCDRGIVVEDGRIRYDGPAPDAVADYVESVATSTPAWEGSCPAER
ncbi:energy-coupling factor ABC transporter ATP-binding protein [Nocardioides sp. AN3]